MTVMDSTIPAQNKKGLGLPDTQKTNISNILRATKQAAILFYPKKFIHCSVFGTFCDAILMQQVPGWVSCELACTTWSKLTLVLSQINFFEPNDHAYDSRWYVRAILVSLTILCCLIYQYFRKCDCQFSIRMVIFLKVGFQVFHPSAEENWMIGHKYRYCWQKQWTNFESK